MDTTYLASITEAAVGASTVYPGDAVEMAPGRTMANTLGFPAVCPGKVIYPAIWIQDFTMNCSSGFVGTDNALEHLRLIASRQNGPEWRVLGSGAKIPPYSIADHILLDGSPVFFPGTYSPADDQGGEPWGIQPPANNHYDFIWLAYQIHKRKGTTAFLSDEIEGLTLFERLGLAFGVPESDTHTGMVRTESSNRSVGFIFCDSIYMTGELLFASLLKWRAAKHLSEMAGAMGLDAWADEYDRIADGIRRNIPMVFGDESGCGGWLRASTGVSGQPDAWGTIYALYQGILADDAKERAESALMAAIGGGQLLFEGAVRHVPLHLGAGPGVCWERTHTAVNRYQNGAYWHTPTGWLVSVLQGIDGETADRVYNDYIDHLRREDFRRGGTFGAPWECIGWNGTAIQNPVFAPSVSLPYAVLTGQPGIRV